MSLEFSCLKHVCDLKHGPIVLVPLDFATISDFVVIIVVVVVVVVAIHFGS